MNLNDTGSRCERVLWGSTHLFVGAEARRARPGPAPLAVAQHANATSLRPKGVLGRPDCTPPALSTQESILSFFLLTLLLRHVLQLALLGIQLWVVVLACNKKGCADTGGVEWVCGEADRHDWRQLADRQQRGSREAAGGRAEQPGSAGCSQQQDTSSQAAGAGGAP